ncbi:prolyl oligopeptidase family serine peptidase [Telluribacter sp. SYSU D00476]|uniref:carboxylesterase family protein n=1 Tax=Telluribacter sp. SYSU D00476 TaxID=2811430 RepID=UPI001FF1B274|nr:prolyl oligopeptidase family serine peptidase [Telluribacter sp. SYSU D00476]
MRPLPLNRDFYLFANLFLGLFVAAGLLQGLLGLWAGPHFLSLPTLTVWLVGMFVLSLVSLLLLLNYYHARGYRFPFTSGVVLLLATTFQAGVILAVRVQGELRHLFVPATLLVVGAGLLHGTSLIAFPARERGWLRAAGVGMLLMDAILVITFIGTISTKDVALQGTLQRVAEWASLLNSLVPVLFLLNFREEARQLPARDVLPPFPQAAGGMLGFLAVASIGFTLFFGLRLATATYQNMHASPAGKVLAQTFEAHTYTNSKGDKLQYRLLKPLDYDPARKYPLVVCLHGGGGWGTDNIRQVDGSWEAKTLSEPANRQKYRAFLFVPQCPPDASWGGLLGRPAIDSLVFETIRALEQEYSIDETRRYVGGGSLGGYGTWHLAGTRPELFAAAMPICGEGDPALASNLIHVPIWAFHGRLDKNVPVSGSRDVIAAIRKAGGTPRYTEFPDRGHDIWKQVSDTPGVLDWLFAQKKSIPNGNVSVKKAP